MRRAAGERGAHDPHGRTGRKAARSRSRRRRIGRTAQLDAWLDWAEALPDICRTASAEPTPRRQTPLLGGAPARYAQSPGGLGLGARPVRQPARRRPLHRRARSRRMFGVGQADAGRRPRRLRRAAYRRPRIAEAAAVTAGHLREAASRRPGRGCSRRAARARLAAVSDAVARCEGDRRRLRRSRPTTRPSARAARAARDAGLSDALIAEPSPAPASATLTTHARRAAAARARASALLCAPRRSSMRTRRSAGAAQLAWETGRVLAVAFDEP